MIIRPIIKLILVELVLRWRIIVCEIIVVIWYFVIIWWALIGKIRGVLIFGETSLRLLNKLSNRLLISIKHNPLNWLLRMPLLFNICVWLIYCLDLLILVFPFRNILFSFLFRIVLFQLLVFVLLNNGNDYFWVFIPLVLIFRWTIFDFCTATWWSEVFIFLIIGCEGLRHLSWFCHAIAWHRC